MSSSLKTTLFVVEEHSLPSALCMVCVFIPQLANSYRYQQVGLYFECFCVLCVEKLTITGTDTRQTGMGDLMALIENVPQAVARCCPICTP